MKKAIIICITLLSMLPAIAQQEGKKHHGGDKKPPQISELVSDLSTSQKRRLDAISKESHGRTEAIRKQLNGVRDSIHMYMYMEGDQSKVLFPLFDREANLQRNLSREMYSTKIRIDEVLTPEQRKELHKIKEKNKKQHGNRPR